MDPVRDECKAAIQDCKTAGIRVIMITGDAKLTAQTIANQLNILEAGDPIKGNVFTGTEF